MSARPERRRSSLTGASPIAPPTVEPAAAAVPAPAPTPEPQAAAPGRTSVHGHRQATQQVPAQGLVLPIHRGHRSHPRRHHDAARAQHRLRGRLLGGPLAITAAERRLSSLSDA